MTMDFSEQRLSYEQGRLVEADLPKNAFQLLTQWLSEALDRQVQEPYAMSLATCGSDAQPSVRTVLMREVTQTGIIFYTNYDSAKGQDIEQNPKAEALFFWHELERQIRVRGLIQKISHEKSMSYFHKRPHDSQVAAWVSHPQSGQVENRDVMEKKFQALKEQYPEDTAVMMPDFWGGYELKVSAIEFWQGRANRMHDRIVYTKQENDWQIQRLLP